jgi:DNA-binding transcriptional LysR family regulator
MKAVTESYPDVQVSLTESLSGAIFMNIMTSEVDLALVYNPPAGPQLDTESVSEETMVCIGTRKSSAPAAIRSPSRRCSICRSFCSSRASRRALYWTMWAR